MLLPFAAGVMSLPWMAALTVFILIEKTIPGGDRVGRVAGVVLAVSGGALIFSSLRQHDPAVTIEVGRIEAGAMWGSHAALRPLEAVVSEGRF